MSEPTCTYPPCRKPIAPTSVNVNGRHWGCNMDARIERQRRMEASATREKVKP